MEARDRLWVIGSIAAMVVVALIAWFLGVAPQLASIASIDAQRASVEAQNERERAVLATLEEDASNRTELEAEWAVASASVPDGTAVPPYIDQLNAAAGAAGVRITRITVSDAAAFTVAPPADGSADAAAGTGTDAAPADPAAPVDPAAPTDAAPTDAASVTAASVITPANFAYLQIGIEVEGDYPNILAFVHALQTGERLMLVNDLEVSAEAADPNVQPGGGAAPEGDGDVDGEAAAPAAPEAPAYRARIGGYIYSLVDAEATASTEADLAADAAAGD
ncbi:hypothetical protein [Agromyces sp. LHK192]|uniref:hypothetical protein n=1 Tax=Agromyces sp. LHK192 TaxID=2498704 RepID=UPI000FD90D94|nr:hypothetical protein [Agromyces sp. LHK192]